MLTLASLSFFAFGMLLVLLGANQAELSSAFALDLTGSGFLGATLALGMGVGVVLAGPFADRAPHRPLYIGACVVTALGLFAIDAQRGYLGMVLICISIGLGAGFYETILNTAIVNTAREHAASKLALVHAAVTAGAGLGPIVVRWSLQYGPWTQIFHVLGWFHVALALLALRPLWTPARVSHVPAVSKAFILRPALVALSFSAFAYVGVESGLTLFLVPWAHSRADVQSAGQWAISSFWIGLLVGRLTLTRWPARRGLQLLAASGLVAALVVCAGTGFTLAPLALVSALAGIALGPVFPLVMSLVALRFQRQSGTAMGIVAACGAAGGFVVPWLVGALGDAFGMPAAMTMLGMLALLISVPALALSRREAPRDAAVV